MAKIVSKLDLNKTPQLVDNNSLIFAKNIRVLKDGIIGPDFPITPDLSVPGVILGYIVGLNSTIYLFVAETSRYVVTANRFHYENFVPSGGILNSYSLTIRTKYMNNTYVWQKGQDCDFYVEKMISSVFGYELVRSYVGTQFISYYPFNTRIDIAFSYILDDEEIFDNAIIWYNENENITYNIYSYNENTKELNKINSAWSWSGGEIHGLCTTNNTGDIILTVCEYFDINFEKKLVPIKHINLSHADVIDESLYTQTPNIPFTNLHFIGYYSNPIPNGVYQFFIRYKIYKDFYTSWFPCSAECFSGTRNVTNTIQGSIQYVDTTLNSNESFVFEVEHLFNGETEYVENYIKNFEEFQIGFIVSHDDSIDARSWKHFSMNVKRIYFDYDKNFIEEINIDDLLKSVYEISNVKNITYFRDKLYISNYIESDINEDLNSSAFNVKCTLSQQEIALIDRSTLDQIVIDDKIYRHLIDTESPYLYDVESDKEEIINKNIEYTNYIPQNDSSGLIYKLYIKAYPGLDPDQLFIEAGYDASINNSVTQGEYALPNLLKTFYLVAGVRDEEDFEEIYFYNNQSSDWSGGQLVYHSAYDYHDDYSGDNARRHYMRVRGEAGTVQNMRLRPTQSNQVIYIHPLNDYIDWFCGPCEERQYRAKIYTDFGVAEKDPSYKLVALQKPDANYSVGYCIPFASDGAPDWDTEDTCENWDTAAYYMAEQVLNYIKANYPQYVLKSIVLYYEDTQTHEYGTNSIFNAESSHITRSLYNMEGEPQIDIESKVYNDFRGIHDKALTTSIIDWCMNKVSPHIIDAYGNVYYEIDGSYCKINKIEISYNEFSYSLSGDDPIFNSEGGLDNGEEYILTYNINSSVRTHITTITYNTKVPKVLDAYGYAPRASLKSLLPFTDYKFYIHYIKGNGVVTNGYQIGNTTYKLNLFDETLEHSIIYPKFYDIVTPKGYLGYFFSIEKTGDNIASCFNARLSNDGEERIVDCLEIDSMLYPLTEDITIIDSQGEIVTKKARYYPSSTTKPVSLLGNVGCIRWKLSDEVDFESDGSDGSDDSSSSDDSNTRYWVCIKNKYESNNNTNRLIKLTPYIRAIDNAGSPNTSFGYADNDYDKFNLPGYYCSVCKPVDVKLSQNDEIYLYVNGTDVYEKQIENDDTIKLDDYESLLPIMDTYNTHPYYIYSNFNLSYLSLFDTSYKQVKYKRCVTRDPITGQTIETSKQMMFMIDSGIISYIYILPSMYKDYTRKLYNSLQNNKLTVFDNVIRSSDANTDEVYKYIYNFDASDYYTVPVNKGKIVNLFNITQNIFIHCEHSLFKFSGNNTLTAKDTEVQLTENDIFDTGITELFDAKYGFAGLQVKHQSLITYDAYIFYDNIANTLYAYFGENNLVNLSDSIYKLLNSKDFVDVLFNADVKNNRFFVNFIYPDNSNICLSYNFSTKSFVSIHDFTFTEGFFTRTGCYFLDFGKIKLFTIHNKFSTADYTTSYDILYATSKLFIKDMTVPETFVGDVENCLDIVCNIEYEKVKLINYVNWICNQINQYADDIEGVNLFVAEENISKYAGSKLRIYSDQCSTDLIELEDSNGQIYEQNTQPISSPNSYIYPRYNCGVWSLNYFRDIKNIEDIFNYKDAIPPTQQEETYNRGLVNSDRSLIYGKYFVLRLIFRNKNFKLENINFNIQDYEKV